MTHLIYKIFRAQEWEDAEKIGLFSGSPDDLSDGFIHFSAANQVRATFDKYFSRETNLKIASVEGYALGDALKWEASRNGDRFPHLYRPLKMSEVRSVVDIHCDALGKPIFPPRLDNAWLEYLFTLQARSRAP